MVNTINKNSLSTFENIINDIEKGKFSPCYFLEGEESYFIDKISEKIVDKALQPEERDFNLITIFGSDRTIDEIITLSKGFPMGANRLVVVVKEAQNLKSLDRLEYYLQSPQLSTILVFCHKNGFVDKRKKVINLIQANGTLFSSYKLKESQIHQFILSVLSSKNIKISQEAISILVESIGSDLNRIVGELEKLCLLLTEKQPLISREMVCENIGLSKDFNIFELQDALINKDNKKAFLIVNYFDENRKEYPIQKILPFLYKFYKHLMLAYYSPAKNSKDIASFLDLPEWMIKKNFLPAMKNYSAKKVMIILNLFRSIDAKSKGVGNPNTDSGELLKELIMSILL